jgi:hypothetical protein
MEPTAVIAFLAPCLGFLVNAGGSATERAADRLGEGVWEHARRLWARLRPAIEVRPAAEEAARDLAQRPDDEGARSALVWQLQKALEVDPALAAELDRLWGDAIRGGVVASGNGSVAVGGSIAHSTIVTGDHNDLRRGP